MFSTSDGNKTKPPVVIAPGDDTDVPMPDIPAKKVVVFPFPLFTTCIHMAVQFLLASLVLYLVPRFRPTLENAEYNQLHAQSQNPHHRSRSNSRARSEPHKGPILTWWFYLTRIGPCGAATSLDIGLGNMSFKYITLTFYSKFAMLI
jgi:solute carrier family 35 protein C2